MLYIDTNILIVFLTNRPAEHGGPSRDFLRDLSSGAAIAIMTEGVLAEATQVLVSKKGFAYPREKISEELKRILSFRGLRLDGRDVHLRALDLFGTTNLDCVDCVLIESADDGDDAIVSFDRDFDRIRVGPPLGRQGNATGASMPVPDQEIEELS